MSAIGSNDNRGAHSEGSSPASAPSPASAASNSSATSTPSADSPAGVATPPSPATPVSVPTPTSPEPASGTALAEDPVLRGEPSLPNDHAPMAASAEEVTGASAALDAEPTPHPAGATDRNWMGYVAFASGALALSVVAIVMGHLGLGAYKKARASKRDFAFAGVVLGYVGLVATAVGLWFALGDRTTPAHVDVHAQQDVAALGAAAAVWAGQTGQVPEVSLTDDGFLVAGEPLAGHLMGERALTLTGDGPAHWCLELAYEGGEQAAFSYTATSGMAQGPCGP